MSRHEQPKAPASRESLAAGHEVGDIQKKPIFESLIGLAILSAATFAFIIFFFNLLNRQAKTASPPMNPMAQEAGTRVPPEPRLQVDAWKDWDDYKAAQDHILHNYSWVDREHGVVRVPIDKAIDMVIAKGLPARAGVAPPASLRMREPVPVTGAATPPAGEPHGGGGH